MDDLLALDGGSSATQWQKRHAKRKAAEARKKIRAIVREERKDDFRKRTRKWRMKWKAEATRRKLVGLPPPSKKGAPRDLVPPNFIDMTGQRFGRLVVIRPAPVSRQGSQRCRVWWVKCDCGSPERMVNGTTLRQGNSQSCGCLVRERLQKYFIQRRLERARLKAAPLSVRIDDLRRRIRKKKRLTSSDSKLLCLVRKVLVEDELRRGVRKHCAGRAMLAKPAGVRSNHQGLKVAA